MYSRDNTICWLALFALKTKREEFREFVDNAMPMKCFIMMFVSEVLSRYLLPDIAGPLFDTLGAISYRCSILTEYTSPAIFEVMGSNILRSRPWPFKVKWRHQSCGDLIRHTPSTIGGPLELSLVFIFNRFRDIRPEHSPRHTPQVICDFMFCPVQCIRTIRIQIKKFSHWCQSPYTQ